MKILWRSYMNSFLGIELIKDINLKNNLNCFNTLTHSNPSKYSFVLVEIILGYKFLQLPLLKIIKLMLYCTDMIRTQ